MKRFNPLLLVWCISIFMQYTSASIPPTISPKQIVFTAQKSYLNELDTGDTDESAERSMNLFNTTTGIALSAGGELNVLGNTNIVTAGVNNTVTIGLTQNPVLTGTLSLNSFTAGAIVSSNTGLLSSTPGANGQVLLGTNGGIPFFTGLSSPGNSVGAPSVLFSSNASSLSLQAVTLFGNTIRVDQINGNNSTASRTNGIPYQDVQTALGVAQSGDTVYIYPGTYTLPTGSGVTIPAGVSVIGISEGTSQSPFRGGTPVGGVILNFATTSSGTNSNQYAFFPSSNSRLQNVTINVTVANTPSSSSVPTINTGAILIANSVIDDSCRFEDLYIIVENTATVQSPAQNINTGGINFAPTGTNSFFETTTIRNCSIYVSSTYNPASATTFVYGIQVYTGGVYMTDCYVTVNNTGSGTGSSGYGVYISSNALSSGIYNSTLYASCSNTPNQADLNFQSGGQKFYLINTACLNTGIITSSANNLVTFPSSFLSWNVGNGSASPTSSTPLVMLLGGGGNNGSSNYTHSYYTANRTLTLKNLRAATLSAVTTAPATFTLYTGTPTGTASSLTATIAVSSSSASDTTHAVNIPAGTSFYMLLSSSGSAVVPYPIVTVEMY